jgi:hypothetical protein
MNTTLSTFFAIAMPAALSAAARRRARATSAYSSEMPETL